GMAEALKMSLCFDEEGFSLFEEEDPYSALNEIIENALKTKKRVVEVDERESGLRRSLNFGHTLGHGIESVSRGSLLHGEAVALGMLPMCPEKVRERLYPIYEKLDLPVTLEEIRGYRGKELKEKIMEAVLHDKKLASGVIKTVFVNEPGSFCFIEMKPEELGKKLAECFGGMD
ncbi:MAG: hypothetical protein IJT00_07710, partial [Lachnospiraceae bacterium]|nr:hypothetical protein [Lachnospiraceae bacterium]